MKRRAWILALASAGAVLILSSFCFVRHVVAPPRAWVPFQVVMVERQYRAGTRAPVRSLDYLFARRGDGASVRSVRMQIMANGGWADQRIIEDFAGYRRTSIDPATESLTTYHYSSRLAARLSTPNSKCSDDPRAAHVQILGYDTVLATQTLPTPGAGIEVKEWRAPQLNCFALREEAAIPDNELTITREALLVSQGPPPASLFEIPPGYVERSPSEVTAERARRFPDETGASAPCCDASISRLDEVYRNSGK